VKDRVQEAHAMWKSELKCMTGYFLFNGEGSKLLVIEFLRWSFGFDVLRIQPHLAAFHHLLRYGSTMPIGRDLILGLCDCDLRLAVVVQVR